MKIALEWLGVLLVWVGLLGLFGCKTTEVRAPEKAGAPDLRVMTFQVQGSGTGRELSGAAIRRSGADIVCLQETTPEWESFLKSELGLYYPHMKFLKSERQGGGMAFLSKTPGREVASIPSATDSFDGWIMEFEIDHRPVQILNVHLHPPDSKDGTFGVGAYAGGEKERLAEIKGFHARLQPEVAAIVAGNFNEEQGDAVSWLERQGMKDALPQFDDQTPTWEGKAAMVTIRRRLDHLYYSPQLTCMGASVRTGGGSDHSPVAGDFSFRDRRQR